MIVYASHRRYTNAEHAAFFHPYFLRYDYLNVPKKNILRRLWIRNILNSKLDFIQVCTHYTQIKDGNYFNCWKTSRWFTEQDKISNYRRKQKTQQQQKQQQQHPPGYSKSIANFWNHFRTVHWFSDFLFSCVLVPGFTRKRSRANTSESMHGEKIFPSAYLFLLYSVAEAKKSFFDFIRLTQRQQYQDKFSRIICTDPLCTMKRR